MEKCANKKRKKKKKDNGIQEFKISNESNFMIKTLEDDLTKLTKNINLFQIIYSEFPEKNETAKFDKANELLNECKEIFKDIEKGNKDILDKWKNKFKDYIGIDEIIKQLKNYDKIKDKENFDEIVKIF